MAEKITETPERILVQVITGGRPRLDQRPTTQFLPQFAEVGDVEWCVREDHAEEYEFGDWPANVYGLDWASEYARDHWRHPTAKWEHGGFFGAFTGREWAMLSGEERGYDAVIQLDDNITKIGVLDATRHEYQGDSDLEEQVRILCEFSASTNLSMLGFQLNSVVPARTPTLRAGYPYSLFIEKCHPARPRYYGPFEDDIMHALDYSLGDAPWSAGVVGALRYGKESRSGDGMRTHYDNLRGLEIAKRYPVNVRLSVTSRTSSPVDKYRGVRHLLNTKGFTPASVVDAPRFDTAQARLQEIVRLGVLGYRARSREKIRERAGRA